MREFSSQFPKTLVRKINFKQLEEQEKARLKAAWKIFW